MHGPSGSCSGPRRCAPSPGPAEPADRRSVIIDSHVHAGEYGRHFSAGFAREMMATTGMPPEVLSAPESRLLAAMDEAGVDQAFLLAFDVQRVAGFKVPNELVAGMCERHPSRFTGFASVDAGTPGAA